MTAAAETEKNAARRLAAWRSAWGLGRGGWVGAAWSCCAVELHGSDGTGFREAVEGAWRV